MGSWTDHVILPSRSTRASRLASPMSPSVGSTRCQPPSGPGGTGNGVGVNCINLLRPSVNDGATGMHPTTGNRIALAAMAIPTRTRYRHLPTPPSCRRGIDVTQPPRHDCVTTPVETPTLAHTAPKMGSRNDIHHQPVQRVVSIRRGFPVSGPMDTGSCPSGMGDISTHQSRSVQLVRAVVTTWA